MTVTTETPDARSPTRRITVLGLVLLGLVWLWSAPGLVSSNDGSHLALARALVLRGEAMLGEEVALTLWVDRAKHEGHDYSDRPPGTALLAAPAVWLGAHLDPVLLRASLEAKDVVVRPAAPRYADTYAARVQRLQQDAARPSGEPPKTSPPLLALQGTALLVALHCALLGVLGVAVVVVLLRRHGASPAAQLFAAVTLGLGSLWGPYSTVLFSHVTAGTLAIAAVLALELGAGSSSREDTLPALRRWPLVLAGLAAGWAVSADYLVGVLVLGLGLATISPRRILAATPWLLLGAAPILIATLVYHAAAFGSPWSLGYDHHANFAFARERSTTFGGDPLHGLWCQWGLGEGAGVLALAPVMLVGAAGLAAHRERRWLVGALPWILILAAHRTPTGGAAVDHRYLVPLMPVLAVGLGLAWTRWVGDASSLRGRIVAACMLALAAASAGLAWWHVHAVWT